MLNNVTIMGRITRDLELKHTNSDTSVVSFSVACERDRAVNGSEKVTDFIDCVAWRHTAEFISKYFHKGDMIAISGRLQIRDWTDKDGNKRKTAEVLAESVYFGGSKKSEASQTDIDEAKAYEQAAPKFTPSSASVDGELPF